LRDRQGLALMARLDHEALFTAGAIYAQLITPPGNEQKARSALLTELERLSRGMLSADELAGARAAAIAARLALLQSQSAHALEYARAVFYKRETSEIDDFRERLSKVSADDVKRVAALYFKPSVVSAGVVRGTATVAPQPPPKQN
jgi:predicted Zn-dependent peptidase